jgi:hypothetical protein
MKGAIRSTQALRRSLAVSCVFEATSAGDDKGDLPIALVADA